VGWVRNLDSVSGIGNRFCIFQIIQNGSGAHPAFYSMKSMKIKITINSQLKIKVNSHLKFTVSTYSLQHVLARWPSSDNSMVIARSLTVDKVVDARG